jgi:hypothetical protein
MEGYFKVHRKILESQVFAHQTALKIWVWCMAKVTFRQRYVTLKIGKGETTIKLLPGQFIFGRFKAEEELNIDGSTIYKWIQKFASADFNMINIESNNQYSIITLCNWEQYQNEEDKEVTTIEQPSSNQVTTEEQPRSNSVTQTRMIKNDKNEKKEKQEKQEFDFSFLSNGFTDVFKDWLSYKISRGEKYKNQKSLEACYRNLLRLANNRPDQAKLIIDQAMGNNWAGLFPLQKNKNQSSLDVQHVTVVNGQDYK